MRFDFGSPDEPARQLTRIMATCRPQMHQSQRRRTACRVGFGTWDPAAQFNAKRQADQKISLGSLIGRKTAMILCRHSWRCDTWTGMMTPSPPNSCGF